MGLWISATLNRYANIGGGDEGDDSYTYSEGVSKKYIEDPKSLEIAKKYGVYLTTEIVNDGENVLFIIHNKGSEEGGHIYEGELWSLPDVKDDETFFQRSEDFIKEIAIEFPAYSDLSFSRVGKRFTAAS